MQRLATTIAVALALGLGAVATGCGEDDPVAEPTGVPQTLQECRDQWSEVGESVLGLDEDPDPSALASRWNSITATVVLYENTESAANCQANIEAQITAIDLLREFMAKLRPYDMEYQLGQVAAAVDLYLNDELPAPTKDASGKTVPPPSKKVLRLAAADLTEKAAAANAELRPSWTQLATVELTDEDAVKDALADLDALAQASPSWTACQEALQVIVAAIAAQEGGVPAPSATP